MDPNIPLLWRSLLAVFVVPTVGYSFNDRDDWAIRGFLDSRHNNALVRAAAIRYCGKNHGYAEYLMSHYREDFVIRLRQELLYVNGLTEQERAEWLSSLAQVQAPAEAQTPVQTPVEAEAEVQDPDSVTFMEDYISGIVPDLSKYPVVEPTMLSLETAEELAELVECVICQEDKPKMEFNTTNCGHHFCHGCIVRHIKSKEMRRAPCPLCRQNIETLETKDSDHFENIYDQFSSTAYMLKECSQMEFGNFDFVEGLTITAAIHKFCMRFEHKNKLMADIDSSTSHEEVVMHLWQFIMISGSIPAPQNHLDLHFLDEFEFHPEALMNFP